VKGDLAKLRRQIDALDERIVRLLNQRLATVSVIGGVKAAKGLKSYSARRTQQILRNVTAANRGPHTAAQLRRIYREIIAASVELQERRSRRRAK
jgi:chorismate mutase / prephenate dehydratase